MQEGDLSSDATSSQDVTPSDTPDRHTADRTPTHLRDYQVVDASPARRNPSPPPELKEQPSDILHGDKIGDTVYSKQWLFATFLKLIREVDRHEEDKNAEGETEFGIDVDEDLQNELCKLWDMSMNQDVVVFMQEFKAFDILSGVIRKSKAPRVTEICVGILGNMACNKEICEKMATDNKFIIMILSLLENTDTPTLVEVTRFIDTCLSSVSARQPWIDAIKEEETINHVMFILQSSTNNDLLKNVGEFVDKLLDVNDEMCHLWATPDMVTSLQEAVKQIGKNSYEILEVYFHIYQLLSTTHNGIEAIVSQCSNLIIPFMTYLSHMCEDEVISIMGHESSLASVVSVLGVIFNNSESGPEILVADEKLTRCLLKVLQFVSHKLNPKCHPVPRPSVSQSSSIDTSDGKLADTPNKASGDNNETTNKSSDDVQSDDVQDNKTETNVDKKETEDVIKSDSCKEDGLQESERRILNVLETHLIDVMADVFQYIDKVPDSASNIVTYLDDSCSRDRIQCMLKGFRRTERNAIEILSKLAEKLTLDRLQRIITDTCDNV